MDTTLIDKYWKLKAKSEQSLMSWLSELPEIDRVRIREELRLSGHDDEADEMLEDFTGG